MTKRFFSILRYPTVVALVASAFVFSSCKDDDDGDNTPFVFNGNILALIKSEQFKQSVNGNADISFDSLVLYLDKYPDLEALLEGTTEYTLFAPSNKAFINLTALPGLKDPDQINPDIIKGVLAYHFVAGKKMKSDLSAGTTVSTIFINPQGGSTPETIKVNADGTLLTGSSNPAIVITTADQVASNGVVHTTGTVLIPNSTGGQLKDILGSLAATVLLGKDFTYMAFLINIVDAGEDDEEARFTTIIATPDAGLTLLAIPNAVFEGYAKTVLEKETVTKSEVFGVIVDNLVPSGMYILQNHLLDGQYTAAASSGGDITQFEAGEISTYLESTLTVMTEVPAGTCQCPTGVVLVSNAGKQAPIVKADIDTEAGIGNGILQVVGGILVPAL